MGQNTGIISGRLLDSSGRQSMNGATIQVLKAADSSVLFRGEARADGSFVFTRIPPGNLIVRFTFEGYRPVCQHVSVLEKGASLGNIIMHPIIAQLAALELKAPPIQVKGDTVEYNADRYNVRPNGTVEDLLNEFAGVRMGEDGSLVVNGETIQQIYVDGKPFRGGDLKAALKTLPAQLVDRVQSFGAQDDLTALTGFDDGSRRRTLNIITKRQYQKSVFGKAEAGAGTDDTWLAGANLQRLNGAEQFFLDGRGNNVNSTPTGSSGNSQQSGGQQGGGGGITSIWDGSANYRNTVNTNTNLFGSFQANSSQNKTGRQEQVQNIFNPDSSSHNNSLEYSQSWQYNYSLNFGINNKFDSLNVLAIRGSGGLNGGGGSDTGISELTGGQSGNLVYSSQTRAFNDRHGRNGNLDLSLIHKFHRTGSVLDLNLVVGANRSTGSSTNTGLNNFYSPTSYADTIAQMPVTTSKNPMIRPSITYMKHLGDGQDIQVKYGYSYTASQSVNQTLVPDPVTGEYRLTDSALSGQFRNTDGQQQTLLRYSLNRRKYHLFVSGVFQLEALTSRDLEKGDSWSQRYMNLIPSLGMDCNVSPHQHLRMEYTGATVAPSLQELHPLVPTTDSLAIQLGNPNLKEAFDHHLGILSINGSAARVLSLALTLGLVENGIQSSTRQLPNGAQETMPVNLSGAWNGSGQVNYSDGIGHSLFNISGDLAYSQNPGLVNGIASVTRTIQCKNGISWKISIKKRLNASLDNSLAYDESKFSLQPGQSANYYTETLTGWLLYYTPSGWIADLRASYAFNSSLPPGYQKSVPLISPALSKMFLKDKSAEVKIYVFDALNQNISITRTTDLNTITETQANVRSRYVMLSFIYHLKPKQH